MSTCQIHVLEVVVVDQQLYELAILLDFARAQYQFWEYLFSNIVISDFLTCVNLLGKNGIYAWIVHISLIMNGAEHLCMCELRDTHISFSLNCVLVSFALQRVL